MTIRQELEKREHLHLHPKAAFSDESRGRLHGEEENPTDVRTCYQRDTDRIVHCKAFRRLMHKTQVFLRPEGDHYRTRMTHTLEVARIARTISRALGLNEDLAEAAAMGVDVSQLEMIRTQLVSSSPALFLLGGAERILAMTAHAAMSMIVCYGVAHKKVLPSVLVCLGIHTMIDLTAGISLLAGTALSQTAVYIIIYTILSLVAVISVILIRKMYRNWQSLPQKEVSL